MTSHQSGQEQQQSLWAMLNDRLHGRWKIAIPLGIVLGLVCAAAGYNASSVRYASSGLVHVTSVGSPIIVRTPETEPLDRFERFVSTQAQMITTSRVVNRALENPELQALDIASSPNAANIIMNKLTARSERNSELIQVGYESGSPEEAKIVVNAVLKAYEDIFGGRRSETQRRRIDKLAEERQQRELDVQLKEENVDELLLQGEYATTDLQKIINLHIEQIARLKLELDEVEMAIAAMDAIEDDDGNASADGPTDEQLKLLVPELIELYAKRVTFKSELDSKSNDYPEGHLILRDLRRELDRINLEIEIYEQRAHARWLELDGDEFDESGARYVSPAELQAQAQQLRARITEYREENQKLLTQQVNLNTAERDLEEAKAALESITKRIESERMELNAEISGRISVAQWGETPRSPSRDRRRTLAAMGLVGGFSASIAFFFLIGGFDQRTFSSRQLRPSSIQYRCLGVLPDLGPARFEPQQSEMAAQCVHQIRNRIEALRDANSSFVLMVSSPFQGDGKTSLATTLGWSYNLAGHRTLLIDCDFIGQGLTHEAGVSDREGLRDLMAQRSLGDQIVSLPAENLDVLGIGLDPSIGPESLRKDDFASLCDELRRQYDVIIVDTGPFLGSIEILPVAAAADGVVLSVRRGRSRLPLENCISELQGINVPTLGVVLNCADQSDCDRYVSESVSISRRVDADESGRNGARSKTLVRAVTRQTSVL